MFCALSVNSKKKKLNIQCMYWENITFLMLWILSMKMYIKTLTQMQTKWNDNYKIMLSTACNLEGEISNFDIYNPKYTTPDREN